MNELKKIMKKRIQPLLDATYKANLLIEKAQKNGYEVNVSHAGTLTKFSKDLVKGEGENLSPKPLQTAMKKVEREIESIEKEGYEIVVTGRRPNGRDALFVEVMAVKITSSDYVQLYYTST